MKPKPWRCSPAPWSLAVVACLAAQGCGSRGPELYPASGTVRFANGDPVRSGTVEFVPTSPGTSPRGRIGREGRFRIGTFANDDGAPAGDYRVVVVQPLPPAPATAKLGEQHAAHAGAPTFVSPKHASPEKSGIRVTVEPNPTNEFEIVVDPG